MKRKKAGGITLAATLIAIGAVLLAKNFVAINMSLFFSLLLPSVIILVGLEIIIVSRIVSSRGDKDTRVTIDGVSVILLIIIIVITSAVSAVNFRFEPFRINITELFNGGNPFYSHSSTYERNYELDVNDRKMLSVENIYGDVEIKNTDGDKIIITAEILIQNNDEDYAEEISNKVIEIDENSRSIEIKSKADVYHKSNSIGDVRTSLTIQVPASIKIEIENKYGDVSVEDIDSDVQIDNSYGKIEVKNIKGEIDIDNGYGGVDVSDIIGEVSIINKHGEIDIKGIDGNLTLKNSYGHVNTVDIKGNLEIENSHNRVYVDSVEGNVDITNKYANIDIKDVNKQINIRNRNANISVRADKEIEGNVDIVNEHGDITIDILESQEGEFSVYTKYGEIFTDLDLSIDEEISQKSLNAKLGNKNVKIQIETKHGNIKIRDK